MKGLTQTQANNSQAKSVTRPKLNQRPPSQDHIPPPRHSHPTSSAPHFSSLEQDLNKEIQEVLPVKTEPVGLPPPAQDSYTPFSHTLAAVEDDSLVYQDDQHAEYEQYQDDLVPGAGEVLQTSYSSTQEYSGTEGFTFYLSDYKTTILL